MMQSTDYKVLGVHKQRQLEDQAWTHIHPRNITKRQDISHSFVCRIIKTKDIKKFRRLKTPCMNDITGARRAERASVLLEKLGKKSSND